MTELKGGELVVILRQGRPVQTFKRAVSEAFERRLDEDDYDGDVIDTWILVTPMWRKQEKKLRPLPVFDPDTSLAEQTRMTAEAIRLREGRQRINARTRGVKFAKLINDDTFMEFYHLRRMGIDNDGEVHTYKLWEVLDDIAHESGRRRSEIEATDLYRRIAARRHG